MEIFLLSKNENVNSFLVMVREREKVKGAGAFVCNISGITEILFNE